ncbi:MAG: Phosphonopyruvate decarboxylase [Pseudomonadota bacterium]
MIAPEAFVAALSAAGVRFAAGVPDSLLKQLCACIEAELPRERHVIAANEGSAVGLAAGWHLATGEVPLVYLQNSGLGNTINPLVSLADPDVYALPMLLVIGWRGEPDVKDEPQHRRQGAITPALLDVLGVPTQVLGADLETATTQLAGLLATARARSGPVALLVRKGAFSPYARVEPEAPRPTDALPMTREAAIGRVLEALAQHAPEAVVVGTTGMPSRELYEQRGLRGEATADFYTVGSMGHASQIALGAALGRPDRRVVLLDGDGAWLMHLGGAATIADLAPANLLHVVLDNAAHDSVGGQPTTSVGVRIDAVSRALGYPAATTVQDAAALDAALAAALAPGAAAPTLLHVRVRRGNRKDLGRPRTSPRENKAGFERRLRGEAE